MISYERSFDTLLHLPERLSSLFTSHSSELDTMKLLNAQLREIVRSNGVVPADEQEIAAVEGERFGDPIPRLSSQQSSAPELIYTTTSLIEGCDIKKLN